MYKYSISILGLLWCTMVLAQKKETPKDSLVRQDTYGLRLGVDLSRPALSFLDEDYTGLEIVADFRLNEKWWLAAELGREEKRQEETLVTSLLYAFKTSGNYLKLGADHNTYTNWFGMRNQIHIGGRYAYSTFDHTLENFRYFNSDRFFSPDEFALGSTTAQNFDSRNASWLELVMGMKAEVIRNIYVGISARLGHLISNKDPEGFKNLWIPGFNKVTEGAKWGVGYNYSISYFLPLYKKARKPKKQAEDAN